MSELKTPSAEKTYINAHTVANELLGRVQELLFELPTPDDLPINWGHVGRVNEVNKCLTSIILFLEGSEA